MTWMTTVPIQYKSAGTASDVSAVAVKNAQARWTLLVSKEISKARLGMH